MPPLPLPHLHPSTPTHPPNNFLMSLSFIPLIFFVSPQLKPRTLPLRASYGVSFVDILEKVDCVITEPHCIQHMTSKITVPAGVLTPNHTESSTGTRLTQVNTAKDGSSPAYHINHIDWLVQERHNSCVLAIEFYGTFYFTALNHWYDIIYIL